MRFAEQLVRALGATAAVVAWTAAGLHAARNASRPTGRSTGLAGRLGAAATYALGAGPYVLVCLLLWRPVPVDLPLWGLGVALVVGSLVGFGGWALYLWGLGTLGHVYNVSSSLGSQLYADHRLVTDGPYAHVRHPMYLAQTLAIVGALLVYRTWTTVFMLAMVVAPLRKAGDEDRLLEAEFGSAYRQYRARVPAFFPRLCSRDRYRRPGGGEGVMAWNASG
jgi:protein-S-isoprenylcysteine O-methyltransferase Ste14